MIGIVNYKLGNVKAFANIYKELGKPYIIAETPAALAQADHIILPGVGAFDQAMIRLQESGMRDSLEKLVLVQKRPVLGVCVGMQMLATSSDEGELPGLGWVPGNVRNLRAMSDGSALPVPHMGWNDVHAASADGLFAELGTDACFYFLHSYYFECEQQGDVRATSDYGRDFACAVARDNVFGVQFHPEKSHHWGIQLLKNFAEL